jgi:hypothetical protein
MGYIHRKNKGEEKRAHGCLYSAPVSSYFRSNPDDYASFTRDVESFLRGSRDR